MSCVACSAAFCPSSSAVGSFACVTTSDGFLTVCNPELTLGNLDARPDQPGLRGAFTQNLSSQPENPPFTEPVALIEFLGCKRLKARSFTEATLGLACGPPRVFAATADEPPHARSGERVRTGLAHAALEIASGITARHPAFGSERTRAEPRRD